MNVQAFLVPLMEPASTELTISSAFVKMDFQGLCVKLMKTNAHHRLVKMVVYVLIWKTDSLANV